MPKDAHVSPQPPHPLSPVRRPSIGKRTDENRFYNNPRIPDGTLRPDEKGVGTVTYDTDRGSTVVSVLRPFGTRRV